MSTANLPPIPIPAAQRWREFRQRTVPLIMFAGTVLGIVALWKDAVAPMSLVGQVEPVTVTLSSPSRATLEVLHVDRLQPVKAGTPIAVLRTADRREELDFMRSQLDAMRIGADPDLKMRQVALDYQRLRLSLLQEKVELSAAEIKLQFAKTEFDRSTKLLAEKAITEKAFDASRRQKEAMEAETRERSKLVDELTRALDTMGTTAATGLDEALKKLVEHQGKRIAEIEGELSHLVLTAPIDGVITAILRRPGENMAADDPVVLITAQQSHKIVGYLREPIAQEPAVGMAVRVQTRSAKREKGVGYVTRVGQAFEPIKNPELHPSPQPESGLPVEISLPPGMPLRPGQIVSLQLAPNS